MARGLAGRPRAACKRAVVTGGTRGIGRAIAELLAAQGASLTLVARDESRLRGSAAEIETRHGTEVQVMPADLSTEQGIEAVAEHVSTLANLDLLVNNAGGGRLTALARRPSAEVTAEVMLNAVATVRLTHAALPGMLARGFGSVLNISAGTAFYPTPGAAVYGAAKALVNSFTEALDFELRGAGVRVVAVCPGFTRTDAQRHAGINPAAVPAAFWADPDDVANAALRAVSGRHTIVSPGIGNRVAAAVGRVLPRRVLLPVIAVAQRRLAEPPDGLPVAVPIDNGID